MPVTLDCVTATPLKVTFRGWLIYTVNIQVNISSWKIHELILTVTGIPNKKNSSGVFELVFFYVEWRKKFITNKQ